MTTFQCHNDNVCKTTFKYSKTTFSKIWTRYGQASCYGCFEDKSENFTIHFTVHSHCSLLLFMVPFILYFYIYIYIYRQSLATKLIITLGYKFT